MNCRVAPQWKMSYFQAHLKILPTSGTIQSPNSIIRDLAQWSCACLSAPPQARSLQHFPTALLWSSGALENSSGTELSHQLQVAKQQVIRHIMAVHWQEGQRSSSRTESSSITRFLLHLHRQPLNWRPMHSLVWVIIQISLGRPANENMFKKSRKVHSISPRLVPFSNDTHHLFFPFTSSPPHLVARRHR